MIIDHKTNDGFIKYIEYIRNERFGQILLNCFIKGGIRVKSDISDISGLAEADLSDLSDFTHLCYNKKAKIMHFENLIMYKNLYLNLVKTKI